MLVAYVGVSLHMQTVIFASLNSDVQHQLTLYVGNFSLTTTEKELRQTFESFGHVESSEIIKDMLSGRPRFAFVEMPLKDEACSAIKKLNGKKLNDNHCLLVNEALDW